MKIQKSIKFFIFFGFLSMLVQNIYHHITEKKFFETLSREYNILLEDDLPIRIYTFGPGAWSDLYIINTSNFSKSYTAKLERDLEIELTHFQKDILIFIFKDNQMNKAKYELNRESTHGNLINLLKFEKCADDPFFEYDGVFHYTRVQAKFKLREKTLIGDCLFAKPRQKYDKEQNVR